MSIKAGVGVFGWAIFLIFSAIVVDHAVDRYRKTLEVDWIPLLCVIGLSIVGGFFQFFPQRKKGKKSGGGNTLNPPSNNGGDDGGC